MTKTPSVDIWPKERKRKGGKLYGKILPLAMRWLRYRIIENKMWTQNQREAAQRDDRASGEKDAA